MQEAKAKRLIDIVGALVLLIVLSPVMVAVGAVVLIFLGRPIFFVQERSGKDEQPFKLVKYRTMTHASDSHGRTLPDEERLTRTGRVLRMLSLDELPELWNVLRGEMSLVGPRPLFAWYQDHYPAWARRRFVVRPGLTGWAQIHGRNATTWRDRLELDVWYAENHSLALDVRIVGRTLGLLLSRRGVSHSSHATMPLLTDEQL